VESSFNSKARSPAGAAGLFQLMPATAESLDLSTGIFGIGDERLNSEKSGRAAARYLRQLHKRFGNWPLALAAYNAGEGRVAELLKKHKAHTFEGIANRLPAETQMYVPKVEAIMRKREGVAFADLKTPKG
jgi:membrane-bound lytic murein transglycosylase D